MIKNSMESCALIWDMDGTLVDSYPAIVPAAKTVCDELGLFYSEEEIHDKVIRTSVGTLLEEASEKLGLDPQPIKAHFNKLNDSRIDAIRPILHAAETLKELCTLGHKNFVYTHRGASCQAILDQNRLSPYFTEILTALSGFPRKPAPDAITYLVQKYNLSPEHTYYVGDRRLDVEAAENAGVKSILYLIPGSPVTPAGYEAAVVSDLLQIPSVI